MFLSEAGLKKALLPLVALSAGTLMGGALFHLIPAAADRLGNRLSVYVWLAAGFGAFFALDRRHAARDQCLARSRGA